MIRQVYGSRPGFRTATIKGTARCLAPLSEFDQIKIAAEYIQRKIGDRKIEVIVTLGSGLGDLAGQIENPITIPYSEIPCFPHPNNTVAGHAGNLIVGSLNGKCVAAMQGRFHLYQGVTPNEAVRPVRTLIHLGASAFIVTNAAGGINRNFKVGDFMLITDHFNLTFTNPLTGNNIDELGPRFPGMTNPYSRKLRDLAVQIAREQGIVPRIRYGVYGQNLGPAYETAFEIRLLREGGIDAIGMSTVPEVVAAAHTNAGRETPRVKILGITLITNAAAGGSSEPTHEEVKEAADNAKAAFVPFIAEIIRRVS